MLLIRWVAAFAATLMIVVSGGSEVSLSGVPTNPTRVPAAAAPTPPTSTTSTSTTSTTSTTVVPATPVSSVRLIPGIDDALCPDWWPIALDVGWTVDEMPTLDRIMWNESRCDPTVVSSTYDYGLVQVNRRTWQSTMAENGWTMNDLLDPVIGLTAGLVVADAATAMGWCRFDPWYMSGDYC